MTYRVTAAFPSEEKFGLIEQMRRAAISIGSNIAEGCGRSSNAAFRASLDRAMGEASELQFQCLVSQDLSFGDQVAVTDLHTLTIRVKQMLARLIVAVRRRPKDGEGRIRRRPAEINREPVRHPRPPD